VRKQEGILLGRIRSPRTVCHHLCLTETVLYKEEIRDNATTHKEHPHPPPFFVFFVFCVCHPLKSIHSTLILLFDPAHWRCEFLRVLPEVPVAAHRASSSPTTTTSFFAPV